MFSALAAGANLLGAYMRNKEAKKASARQMAFQEDMSNTSYQRGMEDMRKAGLNPILAGKLGGASTPTGSTYNPENIASNAVQQYNQTKLIGEQARNQQLDAELKELDLKALKKQGLSPMMMQYTVMNQAGSELYSNAKDFVNDSKGATNKVIDKVLNLFKQKGQTQVSRKTLKQILPTGSRGSGKYLDKRGR